MQMGCSLDTGQVDSFFPEKEKLAYKNAEMIKVYTKKKVKLKASLWFI
ncbi:MAG: hypothetical protein RLY90_242 [Pseudomonadota bacterium]|jgi:hypothetical protein